MPLPASIGRYQILDELGRGAHGAVFRALDPMIERHVAVKTISLALDPADRAEFRSRFLKEAKAAGRLNHPNIVTVFDAGEEQGFAYIVMELLSGVSVRDMLPPGKPLPAQLWLGIANQVAEGLGSAHTAGVVHRDIKPGNIVVGADGRVRITDFGIARVGGSTTGTQGGMILGSPRYMSPEQLQGVAVDARSDLFSLGTVMYEMATGRAPFGEDTTDLATLMRAIVRAEPLRPSAVSASVSPELECVILRALAKRPEDRFRNAAELAQALRDAARPIERGAAVAQTLALDATVKIPAPPQPAFDDDASRYDATTMRLAPLPAQEPQSFDDFASRLLSDLDAFSVPPDAAPPAAHAPAPASPRFPDVSYEETGARAAEPAPSGLLAELAREAQRLRADETASAIGAPDRVTAEARALDRRMRELFGWLNEFVRHLNTIKPAVPRVYPLLNVGVFRALGWQRGLADYRTRMVAGEHLVSRVSFSCTLAGSGELAAEREGPAIEKLHWQLFELNVPFTTEEMRNSRGLVERVRYRMPFEVRVAAVFECDESGRSVRLYTKNVQRFGTVDYLLAPEALAPAMFDEFGKLVLGKPDRFFAWADIADALAPGKGA